MSNIKERIESLKDGEQLFVQMKNGGITLYKIKKVILLGVPHYAITDIHSDGKEEIVNVDKHGFGLFVNNVDKYEIADNSNSAAYNGLYNLPYETALEYITKYPGNIMMRNRIDRLIRPVYLTKKEDGTIGLFNLYNAECNEEPIENLTEEDKLANDWELLSLNNFIFKMPECKLELQDGFILVAENLSYNDTKYYMRKPNRLLVRKAWNGSEAVLINNDGRMYTLHNLFKYTEFKEIVDNNKCIGGLYCPNIVDFNAFDWCVVEYDPEKIKL